jgi:hypothetical protein
MFVLTKKMFDKNLRGAIKHTLLLFVFLSFFFLQESFAQAPGMLEFSGKAVKDNKPLAGAVVTVYRNGTVQQEQLKTGKNGKFRLYLVFGVDYKITFSYPGCVDMYLLVYTGKVSKERSDLFPLYQTEIPFFETTTSAIRLSKFKNPFTKIVFDGKKAFKDDDAYLADFTKDVLITSSEQATLLAEKKAKEKEEKEKLEAELKAKKEAEEKAKNDLEEKLLAEQKAREEALVKAAELARLKRESENQQQNENQSMETEAIRLQKEKEAKALLAKKNKEIKTNYENDLLKMVAENERTAKQKDFSKNKQQARANTVIEQMRRENDLKGKADKLIEEQKLKKKQLFANQQYKQVQMRKLVEAAAFAERSVRIGNQKSLPDTKDYKTKPQPNVLVTIDDGVFTTIRTTVVTQGKRLDTYRKETFFWGAVHCYKNEIEIPQTQYNVEIAYYLSYMNK